MSTAQARDECTTKTTLDFEAADLLAALEAQDEAALDRAGFGVVAMAPDTTVVAYNRYERELSGLSPDKVVGRAFFRHVAPCLNNFLVAERFRLHDRLDEYVDYVFTLRMKPTPVRLRLLKAPWARRQYMLVQRIPLQRAN